MRDMIEAKGPRDKKLLDRPRVVPAHHENNSWASALVGKTVGLGVLEERMNAFFKADLILLLACAAALAWLMSKRNRS
jgi:hypothetical protein